MTEYKDGFPKDRGLYRCKVDGEEKYLIHHHCINNNKHWWSYTSGHDVIAHKIQYTGDKLSVTDI